MKNDTEALGDAIRADRNMLFPLSDEASRLVAELLKAVGASVKE